MEYYCTLCLKADNELPLIELSSNLLYIDKSHYDFPHVFEDLFNINDLRSNFICETCKDSIVQFFTFKKSVAGQVNRHRRMIFSQIDDFLKQSTFIEEIQVIRKLHSITLQIDATPINSTTSNKTFQELDEIKFEEALSEPEDEILEEEIPRDEEIVEIVATCLKCDEVLNSNEALEIHEFLKHSIIGIQIESEVENSPGFVGTNNELKKKCSSCPVEFEDRLAHIGHVIGKHSQEIIENINDVYAIDVNTLDNITIRTFMGFVEELMNENRLETSSFDEYTKQYFYEIYSSDVERFEENQFDFTAVESDEDNKRFSEEIVSHVQNKKSTKGIPVLNEASRSWLKKEISLRKTIVNNGNSAPRSVYECVYCSCHTSNSASGFRYHLINKHFDDQGFNNLKAEPRSGVVTTSHRTKNICVECCLKFKDQKLLLAHRSCHDLLSIVSEACTFPSCSTCSSLFIDETTLNLHLENHENDVDVLKPIFVPNGQIMLLGKSIENSIPKRPQTPIEGFAWSCGHCTLKFSKETSCRFHLLMFHAQSFECPVDKRNFSGFKSVSLFCHHLKNKHSEYFPELSFPCTFCKVEFPSVYEKLSHMKGCSFKKFSCDHCGKKFFKKSELVAHMKFVSGEVSFNCKICDKKCETMSDLKIHLRCHTKEKPFDCSICYKTFRTLAARAAHMESHNTSIVYSCVCGKTFKQRQMYRRHMKTAHDNDPNKQPSSHKQRKSAKLLSSI